MRLNGVVSVLSVALFVIKVNATPQSLREQYQGAVESWPVAQTTDNKPPEQLKALIRLVQSEPEKVSLGRKLFFDTRLSRDGTMSCASCHIPHLHFSDGRRQALGIDGQVGRRNTPALIEISAWKNFFWDGRASTAAHQALLPIADPKEMDSSPAEVVAILSQDPDMKLAFNRSYGAGNITAERLAEALVAFELTIPPPDTRFQQFLRRVESGDSQAVDSLTDAQLSGLHLFRTKARCMTCHEGALLSDNEFHNTGLSYYGRKFEDLGRYQITGNTADVGKFRTPTLLALNSTKPWMHNGLFTDLEGIVRMYNAGGSRPKRRAKHANDPLFPETTDLLHPLNLSKTEIEHLVAFLKIL